MSEEEDSGDQRTWIERFKSFATGEPGSREELLELLRSAQQRELLDDEALSIIEGALVVSDMQTREIMVPRSQVVFVNLGSKPEEFLHILLHRTLSYPSRGRKAQGIMKNKKPVLRPTQYLRYSGIETEQISRREEGAKRVPRPRDD